MRRVRAAAPRPASPASPTSPTVLDGAAGRPLAPVMRADMESRFGHDFCGVRLHSDAENNPRLKEKVIEPFKLKLKLKLKGAWGGLSTGDKIGVVGVGGAAIGLGAGSLLSDPKGRKTLEDVNLATPFALIPYMPLSSFKHTLPTGTTPQTSPVKFETGFDASDLRNVRTKSHGLPDMKLSATFRWEIDPASGKASLRGADASLSLVPGLTIAGGAYKDVLRPPGQLSGAPGAPDARSMVTLPARGRPRRYRKCA